jgi:hypothetical protein
MSEYPYVDILTLFVSVFVFSIIGIPYFASLTLGVFVGIFYYIYFRSNYCDALLCGDRPMLHEWRDTIERFFDTLLNFWIEKIYYFYPPEIENKYLGSGPVKGVHKQSII